MSARLQILFTHLIIHPQQLIAPPLLIKDPFPGIQRLPDTGSLPSPIGDGKSYLIHLLLQLRVFHDDNILLIAPGQIIDIIG